jgi:opacity protein-like surface antigen
MCFRRLLCYFALLMSTHSLYARGDGYGFFHGFYGGISAGVAHNFSEQLLFEDISATQILLGSVTTVRETKKDTGQTTGWWEFFAGCGWQGWYWNCLAAYLGIRAAFNISNFKFTRHYPLSFTGVVATTPFSGSQFGSIKTQIHSPEFTFDAKPGFVIWERTLIFGLIGVAINRVRSRLSDTSSFTVDTLPAIKNFFEINKKGKWAYARFGAGVEQRITCALTLNFTYTYTNYGTHRKTGITASSNSASGITLTETGRFHLRNSCQVLAITLSDYF